MVLVHPHGALPPRPLGPLFQLHRRLFLSFFLCLLLAILAPTASAQPAPNDPLLATLDAPAANSVLTAGNVVDIGVNLPKASDASVVYNSLEVYIVSAELDRDVTVLTSADFLPLDPANPSKRVSWPVATCLPNGSYNLMLYESATMGTQNTSAPRPSPKLWDIRVNDRFGVVVLSIFIRICLQFCRWVIDIRFGDEHGGVIIIVKCYGKRDLRRCKLNVTDTATATTTSNSTESATGTTNITATITPAPNSTDTSAAATSTDGGGIITVTVSDGEITIPLSNLPGTIVVEPSGGAPADNSTTTSVGSGFTTIFKTLTPSATTILVTTEETLITTAPGETIGVTVTLVSTVSIIQTQASSPEQAGLLPVNAASAESLTKLSAMRLMILGPRRNGVMRVQEALVH
ncbi:uncharacterized protein BXZ73DRAFT_96980 [Epithele typhae]|uniref:uncharacterized protein n=1 Tax=Epithele typhae TaxID=378194 RepID=UPI0020082566|nr:uncharacterized protein BXZ73DRAFT_96980 [Epithele typhae]KAH9944492.1 hypothetical protein BXZ73DRAFT_96980 [Epithele typhae]